MFRILPEYRNGYSYRNGFTVVIGPWQARVIRNLHPASGFGWTEGASRFTIWTRRFWSGWHRWNQEDEF